MANELAGKVAIITGGSAGIGRAAVKLFAEEGAKVVIADVDEKLGTELAKELGNAVRFKKTDVSKRDDVQAVVDFAVSEFGGLHAMFNNAGISDNHYGRLLDDTFGNFDRVMQIDVLGVFLGTQIAARHMAKNGGGSIINVSSIAGLHPSYGLSTYRAAKAGVINFTKSAAIDLGEFLIRVNCICPGNIPTDMASFSHRPPGMTQEETDNMNNEIRAARMKRQAVKRQGWPIDIAQSALFFASDRSPQVSGQILAVDSGTSAGDTQNLIEEIMFIRNRAMNKGK
jgi:NAD(P)-dependent dehydrogenase (short-subunit alcohol dehydrogenase family)